MLVLALGPVLELVLGPVLELVLEPAVGMRGVGGLVLSHMLRCFAFARSLLGLLSLEIARVSDLGRARAPETCPANSRL